MLENDEYYTPTIDQFKKGFTYEIKNTSRYGILDLSENGKLELGESNILWIPYTLEEDWDINYIGNPFNLQTYLENGTIRTKK